MQTSASTQPRTSFSSEEKRTSEKFADAYSLHHPTPVIKSALETYAFHRSILLLGVAEAGARRQRKTSIRGISPRAQGISVKLEP